jgi:hypothetical protein
MTVESTKTSLFGRTVVRFVSSRGGPRAKDSKEYPLPTTKIRNGNSLVLILFFTCCGCYRHSRRWVHGHICQLQLYSTSICTSFSTSTDAVVHCASLRTPLLVVRSETIRNTYRIPQRTTMRHTCAGDIVEVGPAASGGGSGVRVLGSGVVSRITDSAVSVAFEEIPEEPLDGRCPAIVTRAQS